MASLSNHVYQFDKLVIGGSLSAVVYAYLNNLPLIINVNKAPLHTDFFDKDVDLQKINLLNSEHKITTLAGKKEVGGTKFETWRCILFFLSLAGLLPLADKVYSIRIEGNNTLKIITKNSRSTKMTYNQLLVFDDENINGLPTPSQTADDRFRVLDWIDVRSGAMHGIDLIETTSDFVKCIHFYPSERIDGKHKKKDILTISYLTEKQLNDFEYSDTMVKFKVKKIMKDAGIKGRKNGRDPKDPKKHKHLAIKIEPSKREVNKDGKNLYDDTDSIKFIYKTEEEILMEYEKVERENYLEKLKSYLWKQ